MRGKLKVAGMVAVVLLAGAALVFATPCERTPGMWLGGTEAPAPADWRAVDGEDLMQLRVGGFPPIVVNVWYVGTEHGIITATRPDGGYWASRVRANPDGRVRIGDAAYDVRAQEVLDLRERRIMLSRYVGKYGLGDVPGMTLDDLANPELPWEVFFWTAR